ncbi:MAG TPA: 6-phospho-3-hexuloisomerase [Granulicella sp.]|jgi:6-phospho-3-hexuloisomerase|nr:6-phospho-3-hexuloisomerase [Granulicella sp.]
MSANRALLESYTPHRTMILKELDSTLSAVNESEIAVAQRMILAAKRVFVTGAGRSGLALRMAAMRLMHLGLTVHVAGEITAPAIAQGDLLLVASGSGTTAGAVHAAEVARKAGADVLAITTAPESKLGVLAQGLVVIPAATKQDHGGAKSEQYAGALFEQSVLLLTDAMFQSMWRERGESAEELWKRHANLE